MPTDIIVRIRKNATTMTPLTKKGAREIEGFFISSACGEAYHVKTPKLNKPISLTHYEYIPELIEEFKGNSKVEVVGQVAPKQTAMCTLVGGVWKPV